MNDIFEKFKKDFEEFMAEAQKLIEEKKSTGYRNTGNCNTGYRNTGNLNTGNCNTGDCNTGNCNTGYRNTGNWNTGYRNTGNCNTGDWNTGNCNTGDCNTGDCNTGYRNTGNCNTGDCNTGDWNTGNWNTGNWNTGYCNTITPDDILIFNKPAKRKDWENAVKPGWMCVSLTKWIFEEDMTDKEKEAYPSYTTTGGYIKVYPTLQAAYVDAWDHASKEDRALTFKLPNFDIDVFKEIFGFIPIIETKETEGQTLTKMKGVK